MQNFLQNPPVTTKTYSLKDRGIQLNEEDVKTLRNVLFAEVSNRNPDRQKFESRLITSTGLNRLPQYAEKKQNLTLKDVLMAKNQYQGYGSKEYNRLINNATTTANPLDQQKLQSIDSVINELKSGNFPDTAKGNVYYAHDTKGKVWLKSGKLFK